MVRINQQLLTLLLALSAGIMIVGLSLGNEPYSQQPLPHPIQNKEQEPGPGSTRKKDIGIGEQNSVALAQFSETITRPLFSDTRRPAVTDEEDVPEVNPSSGLPIEKNQFLVMGIAITNNEKTAILQQLNKKDDIIRVKEGQRVSDWLVESITPDTVKLTKRGTADFVKLSDNILSAAQKRKLVQRARQAQKRERVAARNAANQRDGTNQRGNTQTRLNAQRRRPVGNRSTRQPSRQSKSELVDTEERQ